MLCSVFVGSNGPDCACCKSTGRRQGPSNASRPICVDFNYNSNSISRMLADLTPEVDEDHHDKLGNRTYEVNQSMIVMILVIQLQTYKTGVSKNIGCAS